MLYTSKGLALVLSVAISLFAGFFLYLFERPATEGLVLTVLITFFASAILTYFVLDFLVFREITRVKHLMRATTGKEAPPETAADKTLTGMINEIALLAEQNRKEIDRLRKLEAFRKDLIADISHELKTPIFAAQGFVHTLLDGAVKEKAVRKKFLKKAAKSLDGLDMLVQDLLTLSQIETGQIRMRFETVDLFSLTEEVFDQFREKSEKKEISLSVRGRVRKVLVHADAQRISQVMTNLISNAINYSSPGGQVEVSFSVKTHSVVTSVSDLGVGIEEEHIHRIFERFYRADKSRSREKGGTGLGLAIVKHILEGHNSKPEVESIPGKGSTFSFRLSRTLNDKSADGPEDTDSTT